jgi:nucleobase:cation symporter-1, NCS1 family
MFIPLFGVVLTDYFIIRRRRLDPEDLYRAGGAYWYRGGFNILALTAWAAGFALFEVISLLKLPVGGSIPSMLAAGFIYWMFTTRKKTSAGPEGA